MSQQKVTVEISFKTIVLTTLFFITLYLLFFLQNLLLGLFISVLLATGLNPIVTKIEKLKVPRPLAILVVYIAILIFVGGLIAIVLPPLVKQTERLIEFLPLDYLSGTLNQLEVNLENLDIISSQIGTVLPLFKIATSTFSGVVTFLTFAVITFYLLIERKNLHIYISQIAPNLKSENKAENVVNKIETQIGGWVRGQIILMFSVGFITYVGLALLHVPYALPLAILAGSLEIIPNIGPIVSSLPAIAIPILSGNPALAVFVASFYFLVQQVENNFLVPKVMQSAVGVNPLITMLLIIIGLQLAGVSGAILAVPIFLVSKVVFIEIGKPLWKQFAN